MRLRLLFPLLSLGTLSVIAVACETSTDVHVGAAGAGGEAPGPTTPAGGEAGAAGEPGAMAGAGGACATDSTGTLQVEVAGLPDGVMPDISVSGPDMLDVTSVGSTEGVTSGDYTITVNRVFDADPIVRTVFDGVASQPTFTLCDGASHTVKVTYEAIPSSNKLWMPTAQDTELAGFASSTLGASATKSASVGVDAPGSGFVAFDKDGNLWALGPTVADKMVARLPASKLGTTGAVEPDVSFDLPEIDCLPALAALAFDADGNLWLSSKCKGAVYRIPAAKLTKSGDKTADVVISGLLDDGDMGDAEGLAFDFDGNLWVGGGAALRRFDAVQLDTSSSDAPELSLSVKDNVGALLGNYLAFDKAGNLWASDFAGSAVFEVAAATLSQSGAKTTTAEVSITTSVQALPSQIAFDDGNGLWLSLDDGRFGRLSPAQLGVSAGPGKPAAPATIIKSGSIGAELPLAFFPAPSGLPLYHSLP